MSVALVEGNSGSKFKPTLRDNRTKAPIDLTGSAVFLRLNKPDGTGKDTAMTILSPPTAGKVDYLFDSIDLIPGSLRLEVTVRDASSHEITSLHVFRYTVRKRLTAPGP